MDKPEQEQATAQERPAQALSRTQRRELAARDALRTLLRDHYMHFFGANAENADPFQLSLQLQVDPAAAWAVTFDPPFPQQVHGQLVDVEADCNVFQSGRVYCFRCKSCECSHAAPPDPLAVFHGYSSTGTPEWCALVQHFIEAGDERIDSLYARPPALLSLVQLGRELKHEQLSVFGRSSRTYAILGQVVAGYFSTRSSSRGRAAAVQPFAVTFQAVETRDAAGKPTIALNTIPAAMGIDQWDEFVMSDRKTSLYIAVSKASQTVKQMNKRLDELSSHGDGSERRKTMRQVPRLLSALARGIESGDRRDSRRTRHARQRQREERPIHKALDDIAKANVDMFFYDLKRDTFVVCGERGRAHVFSHAGKHVTSFMLGPGGAEFRVRTVRWRKASDEECESLRTKLSCAHNGNR